MNRYRCYFTAGLLVLFLFSILLAKTQPELTSLILNETRKGVFVDFGVFAADEPGKIKLEIYFQVFNNSLKFAPSDELFKAEYEIDIAILDKKGKKLAGKSQEKSITVENESKTRSSSDFRTSQLNLILEPGKYDVRFTLKDKIAGNSISEEFRADGRKFEDKLPLLSDILFAQAAGPADTISVQFTKGNLMVVPSVARSYGGEDDSRLMYYLEVYPGKEKSEIITVQTLIRQRKGKMVYRDTLTSQLEDVPIRQLREISLDKLTPGEYELEIELQGRRGKKLDETKGNFEIKWTEESLLEHNWSLVVRQISLFAESNEIKTLERAETIEDRRYTLKEFWASKDPFPETPRNELKVEFYGRIRFANENFGYLGRAGWETDRGRVLVRYGVPDQVDDYPFSLDSYPTQDWYYYKLIGGRYRKFTFVDDNHDGDYRLVYPYDGLWQTPDF